MHLKLCVINTHPQTKTLGFLIQETFWSELFIFESIFVSKNIGMVKSFKIYVMLIWNEIFILFSYFIIFRNILVFLKLNFNLFVL